MEVDANNDMVSGDLADCTRVEVIVAVNIVLDEELDLTPAVSTREVRAETDGHLYVPHPRDAEREN